MTDAPDERTAIVSPFRDDKKFIPPELLAAQEQAKKCDDEPHVEDPEPAATPATTPFGWEVIDNYVPRRRQVQQPYQDFSSPLRPIVTPPTGWM